MNQPLEKRGIHRGEGYHDQGRSCQQEFFAPARDHMEEGSAEPVNLIGVEREHRGAVLKDGLHCLAARLLDGGGIALGKVAD